MSPSSSLGPAPTTLPSTFWTTPTLATSTPKPSTIDPCASYRSCMPPDVNGTSTSLSPLTIVVGETTSIVIGGWTVPLVVITNNNGLPGTGSSTTLSTVTVKITVGPTETPASFTVDGETVSLLAVYPGENCGNKVTFAMTLVAPIVVAVLCFLFIGIRNWHWMCIFETIIFGVPGAYLTSLPTTDPHACIAFKKAGIIGVVYTLLGIIFAAVAGENDHKTLGSVLIAPLGALFVRLLATP